MLYFVATPIGNLADITKRALDTLNLCTTILAEDTRQSAILLQKYDIKKKLIPYHQFNETELLQKILANLESGENIALISDAGTPCINDPGHILVKACIEKNIPFTAIPGPCSPILALVLSGLGTERFQYIGFLPKNPAKTALQALYYPGTTIALESPSRIVKTLECIHELSSTANLAIAREMTKTFEECLRGNAQRLLAHFHAKPPKGEMVLLMEGNQKVEEDLSVEELISLLQELHGLSLKEAVKTAAHLKKIKKQEIYRANAGK